ncbi:MAG: hypothetical protein IKL55_00765 [Clostridia bacterium]|nr:hypothetical protein [Clostridia bacterium]
MFDKYAKKILELNKFEKNDILNKKFELYAKSNLSIYYAPHNEIINKNAKIFIVGITPGWTQTTIAYKTAHDGLINNLDYEQIKQKCKINSRFAGSMRKNLIEMLDELNLNDKLNLKSCSELFENKDYLLHTTSVIPYPIFINNKNYTGTTPKIMESEVLYGYVRNYFYKEIKSLPNALIIPLGKSVEEILIQIINEGLIKKEQCLLGFPHPSGANGHRKNQFNENKEKLSNIIEEYFKNS